MTLTPQYTDRAGPGAANLIAVDITAAATGDQWARTVEQTSRTLLDDLGRVLDSTTGPVVVTVTEDAEPSVTQRAARQAVKGVVGVAALEQAGRGRRVNTVIAIDSTTETDLAATLAFLFDEDAAAYCTGATIDLTRTPPASGPRRAAAPVLVTGAAGGLGRAAAQALSEAGSTVLLSDLDTPALHEAAGILGAEAIPCDVTDPADVARLAADPRVAGGLSGLAVYHGVGGAGAIGRMDDDVRDRSLRINGTGVHTVVSGLTPALIRAGGAAVVLASQAGLIAEPGGGAYCAAKFAAVGYVEASAAGLACRGVRIHAICPGPIDTPLMRRHFEGMTVATGLTFDQYWQQRLQEIPLRRFGRAHQLAKAAPFLIGLHATGVVLSATGGVVLT